MLNRRMPNGMYGGVRGEKKSPLLDSVKGKGCPGFPGKNFTGNFPVSLTVMGLSLIIVKIIRTISKNEMTGGETVQWHIMPKLL